MSIRCNFQHVLGKKCDIIILSENVAINIVTCDVMAFEAVTALATAALVQYR